MLLEATIILGGALYLLLTNDKKPEQIKLSGVGELKDLGGKGVILSKNIRLSEKFSNEHILCIAPSGAGKTRRVIMPNVNCLDGTLIITDPSGEIEEECVTPNKKKIVFSVNSNCSVGYNPLANCKTQSEVRKAAQIIIANGAMAIEQQSGGKTSSNHAEWLNMSTPLLTSYMLFNWHTQKYSFDQLIKNIVSMPIKKIGQEIMDSNIEEAKIEFLSFIQVAGAQSTLSCIRNVLNSNLQMFLDNNIIKIMRKKSIDFSNLREKEYAVYIQIPEKDAEYYSPISALFISQLIDRLIEQKNGLQTYFLLDELCNIGYIPGLCKILSTCRKRNISITGCIQSLTQLQRVYGEVQAKELIELFKTLIIMPGLKDSAEYVSNLLGTTQIKKKDQYITVPVLTADEIRRLNNSKCLLICHNKQPVIDNLWGC